MIKIRLFFKYKFLLLTILIIVVLSFKGSIYRNVIHYKNIGDRNYNLETSTQFKQYLKGLPLLKNKDIYSLCDNSLAITSSELKYTFNKCETQPSLLLQSGNTNCIGYSIFFVSVFNHYLKTYHLESEWKAKPIIGKLYLLNYNVHSLFKNSHLKDHDYVLIENIKTGEKIFVDPTLHDYFGIVEVSSN